MNTRLSEVESIPDFSVIITCYNEEKSVEDFHRRLSDALSSTGRTYEIIYVNDGSADKTYDLLKSIFEKDPRVTSVMDLFKNAGQGAAMTAGITRARGEKMVFMDSDFQLDPKDLPRLFLKHDEGYDIVTGYREKRKDPLRRKIPSFFANLIMKKISRSDLRDFGCNMKVIDARIIRAFHFGPRKIWNLAKVISHGRKVVDIPVSHKPRKYGESGQTIRKLWETNTDNLVRLTDKPFQIISAVCLLFVFALILRVAISWFFPFTILPEVTNGLLLNTLIVISLALIAILCVIGEFVVRSFINQQGDPIYIVRDLKSGIRE